MDYLKTISPAVGIWGLESYLGVRGLGWKRTSLLNIFNDTVLNLNSFSGMSLCLWSCFRQLCSIIFLILRSLGVRQVVNTFSQVREVLWKSHNLATQQPEGIYWRWTKEASLTSYRSLWDSSGLGYFSCPWGLCISFLYYIKFPQS